ncbi:mercuric reductase (plasmid) [Tardibacter chloracetimidivorans]|uniref:Mercuric transport protein MerT n=2 Tax=Sphingomonadaceae TaxID=41297 RepID=A0A2A4FQ74_9SPHN|nr:mercuric reductase [Tardibacter chloracetimidivorans]ATE67570.1 mercuric reductase [Rhizorhabdus dicambivorans]PCE40327.1 mercuric reductase [Rhizorhabdus dicambivorans]
MRTGSRGGARTSGAVLLTLGGVTAAFGVAACCALPFLFTTVGISAAWFGGIATTAAPYRDLLLWLSALSLAGGTLLLWRMQRSTATCDSERACTPVWLRLILFIGLLTGAALLWLGYSYV